MTDRLDIDNCIDVFTLMYTFCFVLLQYYTNCQKREVITYNDNGLIIVVRLPHFTLAWLDGWYRCYFVWLLIGRTTLKRPVT